MEDGWELVDLNVDSGASETVIGEDMLLAIPTVQGDASRRGVEYEVANGVRIPNLGEKKFQATTNQGATRRITAQVCEVNKALLSVKKVVAAGNRVVFDESDSYIEDKQTGERMPFTCKNGMYLLQVWVRGNKAADF